MNQVSTQTISFQLNPETKQCDIFVGGAYSHSVPVKGYVAALEALGYVFPKAGPLTRGARNGWGHSRSAGVRRGAS